MPDTSVSTGIHSQCYVIYAPCLCYSCILLLFDIESASKSLLLVYSYYYVPSSVIFQLQTCDFCFSKRFGMDSYSKNLCRNHGKCLQKE